MTKLFQPTQTQIKSSNLYVYEDYLYKNYKKKFKNYSQLWNWSIKNPSDFWKSIADFYQVPLTKNKNSKLIQKNAQFWRTNFFFDFQTNYFQLIEKNKSNSLAIHFIGENNYEEKISYRELNLRVNALSSYFQSLRIENGDVVVGYLPNIADTIIAFLASAKIGAVWSSCSSDFGAKAVIDRFSQLNPKLLIIADHYFYNGKKFNYAKNLRQIRTNIGNPKILKTSYPCKNNCSELHRIYRNKKFHLEEKTKLVDFNHPLYVLFSSGTTGLPKCITHGHGGTLLQHLKELSLHTNVKQEDKMLFLTTCGWMMWNWTVSNLLLGSSIVLYDGSPSYPSKDRVIHLTKKSKSNILGAGAKIYEAIQNNHKTKKKNILPNIKCFISTGSPLSSSTFKFINQNLNKKSFIHSISGGTDIVSCFMLGIPTMPVYAGEIQGPGLGMNIDVFNDRGRSTQTIGELVCKTPFPSKPIFFWNDKYFKKYQSAYFKKFKNIWAHGDYVKKTKNGGFIIFGRSDATLNPGGVRIGSGEIYGALQKFSWLEDCVAAGYNIDNDEKIILFLKLKPKASLPDQFENIIKKHLKSTLSPRHVPWKIFVIKDIPRTKSGKNSEIVIKKILNKVKVDNLGALANPSSLEEYRNIKL